jgi:hypothetical protein
MALVKRFFARSAFEVRLVQGERSLPLSDFDSAEQFPLRFSDYPLAPRVTLSISLGDVETDSIDS